MTHPSQLTTDSPPSYPATFEVQWQCGKWQVVEGSVGSGKSTEWHRKLIREKIEEQLLFHPNVETTNRKPLRQPAPFAADWEIRFGPDNRFRVLYDVDEAQHAVQILAIGEKDGNRLIVAGEEISL